MGKSKEYFPDLDGLVRIAEAQRGWTAEREETLESMLAEARSFGGEFFEKGMALRGPTVGRPPLRLGFVVEVPEELRPPGQTTLGPRMPLNADAGGTLSIGGPNDERPVAPRHLAALLGDWGIAAENSQELLSLIRKGMLDQLVESASRSQL